MQPSFCAAALTAEGCSIPGCTKQHMIYRCACGLALLRVNQKQHEVGKRHRQMMAELRSRNGQPGPTTEGSSTSTGATVRCEECQEDIPSSDAQRHAEQHVQNAFQPAAQASAAEAADPVDSLVIVSHADGLDFEVVDPGENYRFIAVSVQKTECPNIIKIKNVRLASNSERRIIGKDQIFVASRRAETQILSSRQAAMIEVFCYPKIRGFFRDELELTFQDVTTRETFTILRSIRVNIISRQDYEFLQASTPFRRRKRVWKKYEGSLEFYLRPPVWTETTWKIRLPQFTVPKAILQAVNKSYDPQAVLSSIRGMLPAQFNIDTYTKYFHALLYVEEEAQRVNLEAYSLSDITVTSKYPRYRLDIEGMVEEGKHPVMVGSFILVRRVSAADNEKWIQGCIHSVDFQLRHMDARFGDDFNILKGNRFNIRFVLNRLPLRRAHFALDKKGPGLPRFLFPAVQDLRTQTRTTRAQQLEIKDKLSNTLIANDPEQLEAITAVVNSPPGSVPFIIFGPFGTGKTATVVECILQLVRRDPDAHILACAPNNIAADKIAFGLLAAWDKDTVTAEVLRLNALSRPTSTNEKPNGLPSNLEVMSLINDNRVFAMPKLEDLLKYRVVISTCVSAGVPEGLGVKKGHFSHVFIDEAGCATEPDAMISIKSMADQRTNVVLAGDPKQLGPVVQSLTAKDCGFAQSYLLRLLGLPVYRDGTSRGDDLGNDEGLGVDQTWKGVTVVKLLDSYRSHPAIMAFSNAMFYGSQLRPKAPKAITHSLENWQELPKKKFPVMFHSIVGKDEREGSSPSYFNINEASVVKDYCEKLVTKKKQNVSAQDIIVITPYHAQKVKIQSLLWQDSRTADIQVGSVEEFQGEESKVVIISTVRSGDRSDSGASNVRRNLGFVADPKRLNVAITRAKALLIVVGNPQTLSQDPIWHAFISYVKEGGGLTGQQTGRFWDEPPPRVPDGAAEIMERIKAKAFHGTDIDL